MTRAHRMFALALAPTMTLFAAACGSGRPHVVAVHEAVEPFAVYEMTFGACPVHGVEILEAMRFEFPPAEPVAEQEAGTTEPHIDAPARLTADWGFHLLVPPEWIDWTAEAFELVEGPTNAVQAQESGRRLRPPIVLGRDLPEGLADFDHFGDGTATAHVHLFVRRELGADDRHEVYVSKH